MSDSVSAISVEGICPHCGEVVMVHNGLTEIHDWPVPLRQVCPGSEQHPRGEADRRPLWKDGGVA